MHTTKIVKWGGSSGVVLNATLMKSVSNMEQGDAITIDYSKGKIIIRKAEDNGK